MRASVVKILGAVFLLACGSAATPPPATPSPPPTTTAATRDASRDDGQRALLQLTNGWDPCFGDLTDAREVMEQHREALTACYDARSDRSLAGSLQLAIHVAPSGVVDEVRVGGALGATDVGACVRGAISGAQFTTTGNSCAVIIVPYTFSPPDASTTGTL